MKYMKYNSVNKRNEYISVDGLYYKDHFMGYVLFPFPLLETISEHVCKLLNSDDFTKAIETKKQVEFSDKNTLLDIALLILRPFLFDCHCGMVEMNRYAIDPDSKNHKSINLGYPNPLFVSINDPSGDIINVDPSGFFNYVFDCIKASLSQYSLNIYSLFSSKENPLSRKDYDKLCFSIAKLVTNNIVDTIFYADSDENSFGKAFVVTYNKFGWSTKDKHFHSNFKVEFLNFRNINKNFISSKAGRFFSLNDNKSHFLNCCSIKVHLMDTVYIGRIEGKESKPE